MSVEVIRAGTLEGIAHGFLGRRGGVSTGIHAGLNVGTGSSDEREAIARNRDLAAAAVLPGAALVTVHQVHSPDVVTVDAPFPGERPRADALVTRTPGLLLGILTADCAPVLFADREAGVVGAAHAGWKGAIGGVIGATVSAMVALGARRSRIVAVLGPTIGQASYEVGPDFVARFRSDAPGMERFLGPGTRPGHAQFDLPGFILARLEEAEIGEATALNLCTYADPERFYSYRRTTHRGEADYGRLISAIALVP